MPDSLSDRLASEPILIDCPICRHREQMESQTGRCGQCGSEISLFDSAVPAEESLNKLVDSGRVAYMRKADKRIYAVIANRSFSRPSDS
jgi:transcription initiation factor IIE alpha subunit